MRRYLTEVSSRRSSAPIILQRGSAAKNITAPIITAVTNIIMTEHEKTLLAVLCSFLPSAIDIGTDAPTPIRSASEKFIITSGIAIFTAANAPSPSFCPINAPSMMLYIDMANILIIPGKATIKKSFHGLMAAYMASVSRFILYFLQISGHTQSPRLDN